MNKTGGIVGVLVIIGLAAMAGSVFARNTEFQPAADDNLNPPSDEGDDMAYWKVNEYSKYASAIREAESANSIPTDLLARLLYQESRFRPEIINGAKRSPVGALGIAQFMPETASDYGLVVYDGAHNIISDKRTDPYASIAAAGRYLRALFRMFNNWNDALMAYNWGPGMVQRYNRGQITTPPRETREYVAQITADVPVA